MVEAVKLAQAGGLPTRYSYAELWDRAGMDLGLLLQALWRRKGVASKVTLPEAREGMRQVLDGLQEMEWVSDGAVLSKPECESASCVWCVLVVCSLSLSLLCLCRVCAPAAASDALLGGGAGTGSRSATAWGATSSGRRCSSSQRGASASCSSSAPSS